MRMIHFGSTANVDTDVDSVANIGLITITQDWAGGERGAVGRGVAPRH